MINRKIVNKFKQLASKMPILALVGPRQSGKTTLSQALFPDYTYVSLEDIDTLSFATEDPRGFLETYSNHVIIDEVQKAPDLFSYLQTHTDAAGTNGQYILTGSQNFSLIDNINQSLAGRVAFLTLLPLSISELKDAGLLNSDYESLIVKGCYPRIYNNEIEPIDWYPNYIRTYIERDVRDMKNIGDVKQFQSFLKMCASRVGQLVNYSSLANDCGISVNTVKSWLSILEQSYIIFTLQPYHKNYGKRLVKSAKLYFYDTGVLCSLLGIESVEQMAMHYLKGGLFENLVIADLLKNRFNQGLSNNLYFWRDKTGHEIDCLLEHADHLDLVECKSGRTINNDFFAGINYWQKLVGDNSVKAYLLYGGLDKQLRKNISVLSWQDTQAITATLN